MSEQKLRPTLKKVDIVHGVTQFTPVYDDTDHFHFVCQDCKRIAEVTKVAVRDQKTTDEAIYFLLCCPKCSRFGQRKIYLHEEDRENVGLMHPTSTRPLYEVAAQ